MANPSFFPQVPDDELPYVDDIPENLKHEVSDLVTAAYDTVDEERQEDSTVPEPLKSM